MARINSEGALVVLNAVPDVPAADSTKVIERCRFKTEYMDQALAFLDAFETALSTPPFPFQETVEYEVLLTRNNQGVFTEPLVVVSCNLPIYEFVREVLGTLEDNEVPLASLTDVPWKD